MDKEEMMYEEKIKYYISNTSFLIKFFTQKAYKYIIPRWLGQYRPKEQSERFALSDCVKLFLVITAKLMVEGSKLSVQALRAARSFQNRKYQ